MTATLAVRSLFFALAMVSGGSIALAARPTTNSPASSTATTRPATRAAVQPKATDFDDPFAEPAAQAKPGAHPAAQPSSGARSGTEPNPHAPATATPTKAVATPPETPPPHLPSKELAAFMKGFEGSWKCDTQFAMGSLGPGSQPLSAKTGMAIRKEGDGFCWHGEFKLAKTASTAATSGVFIIGYAAATKQATFLSYDSVGSTMMGAGPIAGDSVTFAEEGYMKGSKVKVRETLARKGPRKLYHKVEIEQGKGYQLMAEDTCSK